MKFHLLILMELKFWKKEHLNQIKAYYKFFVGHILTAKNNNRLHYKGLEKIILSKLKPFRLVSVFIVQITAPHFINHITICVIKIIATNFVNGIAVSIIEVIAPLFILDVSINIMILIAASDNNHIAATITYLWHNTLRLLICKKS